MHSSARLLPILVLALLPVAPAVAADFTFALRPLEASARPGGTIEFDVFAFNPSAQARPSPLTGGIPVQISSGQGTWEGTLTPGTTSPADSVEPRAFASRRYTLALPAEAHGQLFLEMRAPGFPGATAILDIATTPPSPGATAQASARTSSSGRRPALVPATSLIDRGFLERFAPHEPIYFVYGPDDPGARFQFSFKYRLGTIVPAGETRPPTTLQFGYTQRSLWDIGARSSPFFDTSYIPEFMLENIPEPPEGARGWFHWLGIQTGYRHESNGRDGPGSRSFNMLAARAAFALGDLDAWNLVVVPEVFTYVGDLSDNPRIEEFRNNASLRLILSRAFGPSLTASLQAGDDFDHPTVQLDLNIPVRYRLFDIATYLLVQYFNGYTESLLDYTDKTETIRAGISFVR